MAQLKGNKMRRKFSILFVAFIVVSGLYGDVCAKAESELRDDQAGPKPQKAKLFEVPGLGGKLSQGVLGGMLDALRDKKTQEEIGLLPSQLKDLYRLNNEGSGTNGRELQ